MASYDNDNIFAKILRGELPAQKRYEDDYALAFDDISPQTPTHILVIPKGQYRSFDDFSNQAGDDEIAGFFRAVGIIAREADAKSYRLISNCGADAGQLVDHFHVHICAGRKLGAMIVAD